MDSPEPWYVRLKRKFLKFWRTQDTRVATVRDIVAAGGIVFLLLASVWIYTGQSLSPLQSPIVVVESGSLMHGRCQSGIFQNCAAQNFPNSPFGRVGTVDPGDLVVVKKVRSLGDVEDAFGFGHRGGYGGHGDVVVYKPGGASGTQIIHRVMLYVGVDRENCVPNAADQPCKFFLRAACGDQFGDFVQSGSWEKYCEGSTDPITLSLRRDGLSLTLVNYPCAATSVCAPFRSGLLTKGDNNAGMDQPGGGQVGGPLAPGPIELEWLVGKARGEIPWFGMIKLALFGNRNYHCRANEFCSDPNGPPQPAQWTILRATAPYDVWLCLFLGLGALISAPMAMDYVWHKWRTRRRDGSGPPPSR